MNKSIYNIYDTHVQVPHYNLHHLAPLTSVVFLFVSASAIVVEEHSADYMKQHNCAFIIDRPGPKECGEVVSKHGHISLIIW